MTSLNFTGLGLFLHIAKQNTKKTIKKMLRKTFSRQTCKLICNKNYFTAACNQQQVALRSKQAAATFHTTPYLNKDDDDDDGNEKKKRKSDREKEFFNTFVKQMKEIHESYGHKVPMSFGTVFETVDLANMLPFPKFQTTLYKRFYAPDFNEEEFLDGAKDAFLTVRPLLVKRDMEELRNVCTEQCFRSLEKFLNQIDEASNEAGEEAVRLEGHVEQIKSAKIKNIRLREVDGRVDTIINVLVCTNKNKYIVLVANTPCSKSMLLMKRLRLSRTLM